MASSNYRNFNSQRTSICHHIIFFLFFLFFFAHCYTNKSVNREAECDIPAAEDKCSARVFPPSGIVSLAYHANSRHKEKLTVRNHRAVWIEGLQGLPHINNEGWAAALTCSGSVPGGFIQRADADALSRPRTKPQVSCAIPGLRIHYAPLSSWHLTELTRSTYR